MTALKEFLVDGPDPLECFGLVAEDDFIELFDIHSRILQ